MIDLRYWLLGDSLSLHPIADRYYILDTGQYHILVKDSASFRSFYSDINIPIHQLTGWSSLNNDRDKVRLVDNFGYTVDSFSYNRAFGGNYTWARGEANRYGRWGRSKVPGGSPGYANDVFYPAEASSIEVIAEPNPFSLTKDEGINIS